MRIMETYRKCTYKLEMNAIRTATDECTELFISKMYFILRRL